MKATAGLDSGLRFGCRETQAVETDVRIDLQELRLANVLADCLDDTIPGRTREILARDPATRQEIEPLLEVADLLRRRSALMLAPA